MSKSKKLRTKKVKKYPHGGMRYEILLNNKDDIFSSDDIEERNDQLKNFVKQRMSGRWYFCDHRNRIYRKAWKRLFNPILYLESENDLVMFKLTKNDYIFKMYRLVKE